MGRLTAGLIRICILAGAGGLCWLGAEQAANVIEKRSLQTVQTALDSTGQNWVNIRADGLQILLSGTVPSEADRFRALTAAGDVIDSGRLVDEMDVANSTTSAPPEFAIEFLRNDGGISLIGMVPASTDRKALIDSLTQETTAPQVTDLLEAADYPAPQNWGAAVDFGISVIQMTPHAKISITPGKVRISVLAESPSEKGRLLDELKRTLPSGVKMTADISTPLPAVAPFTLRFSITDNKAKLEVCAADTQAGQARITDAARNAGVSGEVTCKLALGAPSSDWADVAVSVIGAVVGLGQGTATISDADIFLYAPAEVERSEFDKAITALKSTLPPVFSLQAERERAVNSPDGPAEFTATLTADKALAMHGVIANRQMHDVIGSFTQARFSSVTDDVSNDESAPPGWTVKIIAGIEALELLDNGRLKITPEVIEIFGASGDSYATEHVASALARRLGPGARYHLSVRYDRRLDPELSLPDGNECVSQLNIIISEAAIGFEPGSAKIAGDPAETLNRMSEVMTDCFNFQIEAGGHTDSQGSTGFNTDLSRSRAQALVRAMTDAGINTVNMTSRGYGESQPIASNDTDEGREENRRIEFRLISETPIRTEPLPAPVTAEGVTAASAPPESQEVADTQAAETPENETVAEPAPPSTEVNDASDASDASVEISDPLPPDPAAQRPPPKPETPVADDIPDDNEAAADEPF